MHPIEDFVKCFTFLQELGQYYLEVKEIEIKHVLSDLFVEILLPVAAVARQEVNIPALKTFVENLYPTSLELASKKKHIPVSIFLHIYYILRYKVVAYYWTTKIDQIVKPRLIIISSQRFYQL